MWRCGTALAACPRQTPATTAASCKARQAAWTTRQQRQAAAARSSPGSSACFRASAAPQQLQGLCSQREGRPAVHLAAGAVLGDVLVTGVCRGAAFDSV